MLLGLTDNVNMEAILPYLSYCSPLEDTVICSVSRHFRYLHFRLGLRSCVYCKGGFLCCIRGCPENENKVSDAMVVPGHFF